MPTLDPRICFFFFFFFFFFFGWRAAAAIALIWAGEWVPGSDRITVGLLAHPHSVSWVRGVFYGVLGKASIAMRRSVGRRSAASGQQRRLASPPGRWGRPGRSGRRDGRPETRLDHTGPMA